MPTFSAYDGTELAYRVWGAPPSVAADLAGLLQNATFVLQPGAGHLPWLDDAGRFVAETAAFLE